MRHRTRIERLEDIAIPEDTIIVVDWGEHVPDGERFSVPSSGGGVFVTREEYERLEAEGSILVIKVEYEEGAICG